MIQDYPLMEPVQFTELTSVIVTDAFNPLFDVEKTAEENLSSYCQSLIRKVFQLKHSQISDFINHHCDIAKNTMHWLNRFEELILVNTNLFCKNKNENRFIKLQTCIEVKRYELNTQKSIISPTRPCKKDINAISEERYFSFKEVKEKLNDIKIFEEKLVYLTHQKYDYQESVIDFINKNLPPFDELCSKEIERLNEVKKLVEQLPKSSAKYPNKPLSGNKIKINSNLNQLVDVFFQLNREKFVGGKPVLDGNTGDFVSMICNNFVDKDGHELSQATVQTIFRPSKYDKRPKSHNRINVDEIN
ncbi:hypothetical protein AAH994_10345 [Weeksellaceae bacterium A-14]